MNLTVAAPRWISPEDLLSAMRDAPGLKQMKDARDVSPGADPRAGRADPRS